MSQPTIPTPARAVYPPFESPCTHPDCTHIFRLNGTENPLSALAAMVKAHRPHCVRLTVGASYRCCPTTLRHPPAAPSASEKLEVTIPAHRWDANWTPPDRDFFPQGQGVISICRWTTEWQSLVDGSGHKDDEVRVESKGGATGVSADLTASPQGAPSVSCRTSISLPAPQVDANHASSSADTDQQTLSVNATDFSLSNDVPPKRSELIFFHVSFADGARSHTKTRRRKTRSMPEDASLVTPQHIKKSCDTDSERYDKLQADEWTAAVDIQRVLCRGCGGTTLLDQREGMRYYPGAWNKHRGRCRKIKSGKGLEGADHARAVYAFWNPQAGVEADNRTKRTARKSRVKPY